MDFLHFGDLIFFALVAGILLYRLRVVLGRKDFNHKIKTKAFSPSSSTATVNAKKEKNMTDKESAKSFAGKVVEPEIKDSRILAVIEEIKTFDSQFSPGKFLYGARIAFEMVLDSFNKGDKVVLKELLESELYNDFVAALGERDSDKIYSTTLVSINSADIVDASISNKIATITVKFVSEQIDLVKDIDGNIIEGNPSQINIISDVWVFRRNVASSNPNWKLSATEGRD